MVASFPPAAWGPETEHARIVIHQQGSKTFPLPRSPFLPTNFEGQRRGGTGGCHGLVHIVLSDGRRPRATVRPNVCAMPAFKNSTTVGRGDSLNQHELRSFVRSRQRCSRRRRRLWRESDMSYDR